MPRKKKDENEEAIDGTPETTETATDEMSAEAASAEGADSDAQAADDTASAEESFGEPIEAEAADAAGDAVDAESVEAQAADAAAEEAPVEAAPAAEETPVEAAPAAPEAPKKPRKSVAPKTSKKAAKPVETGDDAKKPSGKRAEKIGIISSDKMMKTVTVRVDRLVKHPVYRKYVKKRKKFMAHDDLGAKIGDKVKIVETRPLSARKRWRVVEILQRAES
jgi:small subunit ribosomal protein S17